MNENVIGRSAGKYLYRAKAVVRDAQTNDINIGICMLILGFKNLAYLSYVPNVITYRDM